MLITGHVHTVTTVVALRVPELSLVCSLTIQAAITADEGVQKHGIADLVLMESMPASHQLV